MDILEIIKSIKKGGVEADKAIKHLMPPMDMDNFGLVSIGPDDHLGYKKIKKYLMKNFQFNSNADYEDIIFNSISQLFISIDNLEIRTDAEVLGWFWTIVRNEAGKFSIGEQKSQGDKKKSEELIRKMNKTETVQDKIKRLEKKLSITDRKNVDEVLEIQAQIDLCREQLDRIAGIGINLTEAEESYGAMDSASRAIKDCVDKVFDFLTNKYERQVNVYRAKEIEGKSIAEIIGEYFSDEIDLDKKKISVLDIFTKKSPYFSPSMNRLYKKVKVYISDTRKRIEPHLKKCWDN